MSLPLLTFDFEWRRAGGAGSEKAVSQEKFVANVVEVNVAQDQTATLFKYAAVVSSLYSDKATIQSDAERVPPQPRPEVSILYSKNIATPGYKKWAECDITIERRRCATSDPFQYSANESNPHR